MKTYKTIDEVWNDLDKGVTIYCSHTRYKLYKSKADCEYQYKHFSNKGGEVLSVRFIETYWGGVMNETDMSHLFSEAV